METPQVAPDQAQQPVPEAVNPVNPSDAQSVTDAPRLDQQGEHQAPAPTSGDEEEHSSASAQPDSSFDPEEFVRLREMNEQYQRDLQEKEQVLAQIQRMADEQKALQANQQLRGEIEKELAVLREQGVEDNVIAQLADRFFSRLDETRNSYQQQMAEYQQQVEQQYQEGLWAAAKDGYADYLIREHKLDPVYLPRLKQATSEEQMTMMAVTLRDAQKFYQEQSLARTVQQQEEQRRASGVDAIAGTTSGPLTSEPLKPGRNLDVLGALLGGV